MFVNGIMFHSKNAYQSLYHNHKVSRSTTPQSEKNLYLAFNIQAIPDRNAAADARIKPRIRQWWLLASSTSNTFSVCSSVSLWLLEFSMTKCDSAHFFSSGIWAAIRFFASASDNRLRSINRDNWMSSSLNEIELSDWNFRIMSSYQIFEWMAFKIREWWETVPCYGDDFVNIW